MRRRRVGKLAQPTMQQETGADIAVSDDGVVGTVSIGSKDGSKVEEARRRIMLILDPPTADVGEVYMGRVVNITKFGAFVNILPGRDGLLHISKMGRGKRIDKVEDVFSLGDEVEVRVEDIDNSGKLSLALAGDDSAAAGSDGGSTERAPRPQRSESRSGSESDSSDGSPAPERERASFEQSWDEQASGQFGDLGPAAEGSPRGGGDRDGRGGNRGGRRR